MAYTNYNFAKLPVEETITIRRGATFYQPYQLYLNGDPWDLEYGSIRFIVKDSQGNTVVNVTLTSADMDNAFLGQFTLQFDTSTIEVGEYDYEMWLILSADDPTFGEFRLCLLAGSFNVESSLL